MSELLNIGKEYSGLPISDMIANPFLGVSEANAVNTENNLASVKGLAETTLEWDVDRQVNLGKDAFGVDITGTQKATYRVPALFVTEANNFLIDELTVDFEMEVNSIQESSSKTEGGGEFAAEVKVGWGFLSAKANLKGNVSHSSNSSDKTDRRSKYKINAKGTQHAPTDGMQRLTDVLCNTLTPIAINSEELEQSKVEGTEEFKAKTDIDSAQMDVDKKQISVNITSLSLENLKKKPDVSEADIAAKQKQLAVAEHELGQTKETLFLKQQALQMYRRYQGKLSYESILSEISNNDSNPTLSPKETPNDSSPTLSPKETPKKEHEDAKLSDA